jgi:hypothetical protein
VVGPRGDVWMRRRLWRNWIAGDGGGRVRGEGGGGGRKIQCGTNRNKIQLMPGSRCWTEDGVREYPHAVDLSIP